MTFAYEDYFLCVSVLLFLNLFFLKIFLVHGDGNN